MPEPCLIDNDVVLKIAAYGLHEYAIGTLKVAGAKPAMLGVGRFVVRKKVTNKEKFHNPEAAESSAAEFLKALQVVEPTDVEIELAADLEARAVELGESFDTGEAQLLAVLLTRKSPALVTGDKRAIQAISKLEEPTAHGRGICLEQLIAHLTTVVPVEILRDHVCGEPVVDKAMTNCFACSSMGCFDLDLKTLLAALNSYIEDLRANSNGVLVANYDVLSLTT